MPAPTRLFATTELVARLERAEASLIADSYLAAERRDPDLRGFATPLAGGVAAWGGASSPINKVAGLGFGGPLDEAELAAVERAYAERGSAVQIELATLAEPSLGKLLTGRGYRLVGFENVLGLALAPDRTAEVAPEIEVAESAAGGMGEWLDLVITGFASPDTQGLPSHEAFPREVMERVMGDLGGTSGFVRYLARRRGEPAGGAGLRLCQGVAQLCGAATLPAHRRNGVQSSLLSVRLAAAAKAGCDVAVVTTQPGSKSQENVQRLGFDLLYARAVLVRSL